MDATDASPSVETMLTTPLPSQHTNSIDTSTSTNEDMVPQRDVKKKSQGRRKGSHDSKPSRTSSLGDHANSSIEHKVAEIRLPSTNIMSSPCTSPDEEQFALESQLSPSTEDSFTKSPCTPPSPIFDAKEQLRLRLAKLTRQFGEEIPPELVSTPPRLEAPPSSFPSAVSKGRRRQSFDFSNIAGTAPIRKLSLRGTRSLWRRQPEKVENVDQCDEKDPNQSCKGSSKPVNEKLRILNVKRARKMAQVFGSEPPPELYVVNVDDNDSDTPPSSPPYSPPPQIFNTELLSSRHSLADSIMSSIIELPLPTDDDNKKQPVSDVKLNDHSAPFTDFRDIKTLSKPAPSSTQTHARFASLGGDTMFSERRRRAAKLSRFFGVELQDLTSSMDAPRVPLSLIPARESNSFEEPNMIQTVDVRITSNRLWGANSRDADVTEVIDKLRNLRAG